MLTVNKNFLQESPISLDQINEVIQNNNQANIGAYSIFLGQVRADKLENKIVTAIEYSAYDEMVTNEMQKVINIVIDKYPDIKRIYIMHAKGLVKVGEISLFVFVGSGHRKQAFRAVEGFVELIKERVPIWKKELFDDNTHKWPENK